MLKRWIGLFLCIALVLSAVPAPAEQEAGAIDRSQGVVVANYQEMMDAVNGQKANLILISSKYRYKKPERAEDLSVEEGRTVIIAPEQEGEEAVTIQESIAIAGKGTVKFDRVNLAAPAGESGLSIACGAHVTIGSVTAGQGKANGCTAVCVSNSFLTIDSAIGSDAKAGIGGDGIEISGTSVVEIREAAGGNAPQGIGGSGIVIAGDSEVTVTGSAKGGDGLYAAGKGVLAGWGSKQGGSGTVTDGTLLEGKKKLDPEVIADYLMLVYAIRSGKTEIRLDPKFRSNSNGYDISLIAFSDQPVRITGNPEGKHLLLDCGLSALNGNWTVDGLDIKMNGTGGSYCLSAGSGAKLTFNGDLSIGNGGLIYVYGGDVEMNGNAQCNSGKTAGIATPGWGGSIRMNGNLQMTKDANAVYSNNGIIEINGSISGRGNKNFPLLWSGDGGDLRITGDVSLATDTNLINVTGGKVEITGALTGKNNQKYPLIFVAAGEMNVTGPVESSGYILGCTEGKLRIAGNVTCKRNLNKWAVYVGKPDGEITIDGDLIVESWAAYVDGGLLAMSGQIQRTGKDQGNLYETWNGGRVRQHEVE